MDPHGRAEHKHFGFLTLSRFSMLAFTHAVEVLRMANDLTGETLYRWTVYSSNGAPVAASNGFTIEQTERFDAEAPPDILFVCGGVDSGSAVDDSALRLLKSAARAKIPLGALCAGSLALAQAGLLAGNRYTCSGSTAPLNLLLDIIAPRIGKSTAARIAEQFILDGVRDDKAHLGFNHKALSEAAALMEGNIEEPLSLEDLAGKVSLSPRQLQRMFRHSLRVTPTQYYLSLRLRRARELLLRTSLSIMDVTLACGFQSPCHFSKSYRALFGHSPSAERGKGQSMNELIESRPVSGFASGTKSGAIQPE
jgi:transcriptional regulator GlxA family with amidase domain